MDLSALVSGTAGGLAVLIACGWILRKVLEARITKHFTEQLEAVRKSNQIELERFKADLRAQHKAAEIAFSAYHAQRFRVARELFVSLQKVNQLANPETAGRMIMSGPAWSDMLDTAHEELQETVIGTSLFLTDETMKRVAEIQRILLKITDLIGSRNEEEAIRLRQEEVVPKMHALRDEFRILLQKPG